MKYNKEPLTFDQQISLLESRGLIVSDRPRAVNYLSNISYYRLSAYMLPLKVHEKDQFKENISLEDVISLYRFDRELRILIFDVVEKLEIAFRTQISYHHSLDYGPYWFEDRNHFRDAEFWRKHLENIDIEVGRANEVFKDHFFGKYDEHERMPIWMTSEVLSLGLLSKIYRSLKMSKEKRDIARHFGIGHPLILESWMQSITYVRNICAHHSRLWNRVLTLKPNYMERPLNLWITNRPDNDKVYYFICCLFYMIRAIDPNTISKFNHQLHELLGRYPKIDLVAMGFPNDWDSEPFWK